MSVDMRPRIYEILERFRGSQPPEPHDYGDLAGYCSLLLDRTPLTEECLRECGFERRESKAWPTVWIKAGAGVFYPAMKYLDGRVSLKNPTNGDLRMLCAVLGRGE